jgi:hypothetical protein
VGIRSLSDKAGEFFVPFDEMPKKHRDDCLPLEFSELEKNFLGKTESRDIPS